MNETFRAVLAATDEFNTLRLVHWLRAYIADFKEIREAILAAECVARRVHSSVLGYELKTSYAEYCKFCNTIH